MCPIINCGIFSRKSKTVPSEWMQYIEAFHFFISCNGISYGIVSQMPHMQLSGRIGEHFKSIVVLFPLYFIFTFKNIFFLPFFLPLFFNFRRFVFFYHFSSIFSVFINLISIDISIKILCYLTTK